MIETFQLVNSPNHWKVCNQWAKTQEEAASRHLTIGESSHAAVESAVLCSRNTGLFPSLPKLASSSSTSLLVWQEKDAAE